MRNKQAVTEKLIKLLPDNKRPSIEEAMLTWWFNLRDTGGLRLTNTGYKVLKTDLELESWQFELKRSKNKRVILALDRRLKWPYYIERKHVEFFNSKEAMMAQMYPDLESWLKLY